MATVLVTRESQRQIDGLPLAIQARMWRVVKRLERWPDVSGAKPLSGKLAGQYRMRTGDYRMQFSVETTTIPSAEEDESESKQHTVLITKVGHRDRFYDD
jgi:mRNA-degrading endonuclease RelE of RelBE toxin-antitoxin system